ncbi:MAG: magnesium transporter [Elusimicrobiota bacterium]
MITRFQLIQLARKLKKFIRTKDEARITRLSSRIQPADMASIWHRFDSEQRILIFKLLLFENKVRVFENLPRDFQDEILKAGGEKVIASILNEMAPDNRADMFFELDRQRVDYLLSLMKREEAEDVKELLAYEEDTAGGRMTTEFVSVPPGISAKEALLVLQKEANRKSIRNIHSIYVSDDSGLLVSGISLQRLLAADPESKIEETAKPVDKIKVYVNDDQEHVAHLFAHYDLLSAPVVNREEKLEGIITIDDIIDVIEQENSEDMALHAGIEKMDYDTDSIIKATKARWLWLMTSFAGGIAAAVIIGFFEGALQEVAALAVFIPIIMDMGGNVGVQSSTVVVRRLALEKNGGSWLPMVLNELKAGLIIALGFGIMLWVYASWRFTSRIGQAGGLGIILAIALSACLGAVLPVIFHKKNIDPAVSTGPLITTAIDVLGLGVYFLLALWLVL